jgi:hypothetical protein
MVAAVTGAAAAGTVEGAGVSAGEAAGFEPGLTALVASGEEVPGKVLVAWALSLGGDSWGGLGKVEIWP